MPGNPVFGNELRKTLIRRKSLLCFSIWAGGQVALFWILAELPDLNAQIFSQFPLILLPIYALAAMWLISSIDGGPSPRPFALQSVSVTALGAGDLMHLATSIVLTIGFWILLAVGLRFDPE